TSSELQERPREKRQTMQSQRQNGTICTKNLLAIPRAHLATPALWQLAQRGMTDKHDINDKIIKNRSNYETTLNETKNILFEDDSSCEAKGRSEKVEME